MPNLPFPDALAPDERLVPVDRDHLLASIAIALRSGTRHENQHTAEAAAKLIAEKVVEVIAQHRNYMVVCREKPHGRGTPAVAAHPPSG